MVGKVTPIFEILIEDFELAFELDPLVLNLPEGGCAAEHYQNAPNECVYKSGRKLSNVSRMSQVSLLANWRMTRQEPHAAGCSLSFLFCSGWNYGKRARGLGQS
jgi:hypothetical protein